MASGEVGLTSSLTLPPTIILAGGLGTRLGALSADKPKAMVTVNGEPFIAHQLRLLRSKGVHDVVLSVKHFAKQIEDFVGNGSKFGLNAVYSDDGQAALGTGGAVLKAVRAFGLERFAVLYGDSYLNVEFAPIYAAFLASGKLSLMTVFENNNELVPSNVWLDGERIMAYGKENPSTQMRHVDYGLSFYERTAFAEEEAASKGTMASFDLGKVTRNLIAQEELAIFRVSQRFYEVGTPEAVATLSKYLEATL